MVANPFIKVLSRSIYKARRGKGAEKRRRAGGKKAEVRG
jgi:hypothetical protein